MPACHQISLVSSAPAPLEILQANKFEISFPPSHQEAALMDALESKPLVAATAAAA